MCAYKVGPVSAQRGEIAFGGLPIAEQANGAPLEIPICLINGGDEGPCLWIQNGVHGDEYVGAAAIGQLIHSVDVRRLRGRLIVIPVLNIQAFLAGARMAPQDGLDMNRTWPGAQLERAMHLWAHTELVTHTILELIVEHADALLDVHDAGHMGLMSPYAAYYQGADERLNFQVKKLAFGSGMDLIWETIPDWVSEKVPGSIKTQMIKASIPSITLEIGGEGRLQPEHVERMYLSFVNILKVLGMVDGEPRIPENQIFVNRGNWLRASKGGLLQIYVRPLEQVAEGQRLAMITDLFGRQRETLLAPTDGWIVGVRTLGTVATGQYVTNVAHKVRNPVEGGQ